MKKMKGLVDMESPSYAVYEDARTRFRHQSLLQDYEELQKERETMKRKLLILEQQKLVLSAEVSFLRRRYKYLTTDQFLLPKPNQGVAQSHTFEISPPTNPKDRNNYRKKSAQLRPSVVSERHQKERTYNGVETSLPKLHKVLDLIRNGKNFKGKNASFQGPASAFDLDEKEGMHPMKEVTKKNMTPVFDLNEISRDEDEELQVGCEQLNMEEPKRNIQRNANDDQDNDMKISVCRIAGVGSSRTGKRKISWQDQVALRV